MTSFRKFLEIAINLDAEVPASKSGSFRGKQMVHGSDHESHRIIPFVVHQKVLSIFSLAKQLGKWDNGVPQIQRAALEVLERLGRSGSDGMLVTYISNLEAESVKALSSDMIRDSASYGTEPSGKWASLGKYLMNALDNGIKMVSSKQTR